jgi:hypothetical protein
MYGVDGDQSVTKFLMASDKILIKKVVDVTPALWVSVNADEARDCFGKDIVSTAQVNNFFRISF